jgi:hypothetical protein
VQALVEASRITVEVSADGATTSPRPLSFAVYDREILGLWLPSESFPSRLQLQRVLAGHARPAGGVVRRRAGARLAIVRPDALQEAPLKPPADLVILDAGGSELGLRAWMSIAVQRERGLAFVLLTTSPLQAYRCDRVSIASWTLPELERGLEALVENMRPATQELLGAATLPRRAAVLATELRRCNRAVRALTDQARREAGTWDERVRISELSARAAGVTLDERILEGMIEDAEKL